MKQVSMSERQSGMMNQIHHTLSDVTTHVASVLARRARPTFVELKVSLFPCVALLSVISVLTTATFC